MTVQTADRILVMQKGAIVEEGNHSDLVDKAGYYAHLNSMQGGYKVVEGGRK